MQDFHDLKVWQKAHAMALSIYAATANFPSTERFGLTSQMRRAAASIPANIAEGCVRSTDRDFLLARDLKFLDRSVHDTLTADLEEIKRMLSGLIARLKADG